MESLILGVGSSTPLPHRYSVPRPGVCRFQLRQDPCSVLQASGIDFPEDSLPPLGNRRSISDAVSGAGRPDCGRVLESRQAWGEVGSPWRLRWPLLRLEHDLNDLRCFFLRSRKLPSTNRICGRFDQCRPSAQRPRRLNTPIWPHRNFQLHHSLNVGTSRELRIYRSDSFDRSSSRMDFCACAVPVRVNAPPTAPAQPSNSRLGA
jgi:hypothetical protein